VSPTLDAFLRSWPFDPWLFSLLLISASIYLRGWLALRRHNQRRWRASLAVAFMSGLAVIYVALASPIDPFAALLLQVHMLQHLLLMMIAPPLLWLGAPWLPWLRGLPQPVRVFWVVPVLSSRSLRRLFGWLTHPARALPIFIAVNWFWHLSPVYDLAMRSSGWHYLQHICFLGAALLFWYPVVRPYPSRPGWSLWLLLPYLLLADLSNTALSLLFTFSSRALYAYYTEVPRLAGISVLEDQSSAGVIMWVPGSLVFLVPLFVIGIRLLRRPEDNSAPEQLGVMVVGPTRLERLSLPLISSRVPGRRLEHTRTFDLLRVPLLGRFLKWRHARLAMQLPLVVLAGILILDGLRGPQVGAMNLAGVLPWIHWRGLLIVSLLTAGNFFCTACPFLVPRTLARRWLPVGRSWPRLLRSKWLAVVLTILFLWGYEAFSLWDRPWWTAWLALSYFGLAFVVDGLFRGAAFCKYLCPIGQFNFVQSLVSPLEVKVREAALCATCRTKDCIRGRDRIPGCELHLFQPTKATNMDCTFCLDCIHACPHDNIGILPRPPGSDLWHEAAGSGVGRLGRRPDLAALVVVLVFGAFANAAGMVGPIVAWLDQLSSALGQHSPLLVTSLFYLFGIVVVPVLAVGGAAAWSRRWARLDAGWFEVATRYAYALVPLGFGMWLAHYGFHLLTSYDAVVPAAQRFASEVGWPAFGQPRWLADCCRPVTEWLPRLEVVFLDLGLLLSLYTGYRIALRESPHLSQALRALAPFAFLMALLFATGIWLVFQPMQMRGMLN
jgi:cytochrome c oxidase assembly factor CtaG/polyferredoxin